MIRLKKIERAYSGRASADLPLSRVLSYRPQLFGSPWRDAIQDVMRGPSEWSPGERELFAAFVSQKNRCSF